ncbi:LrgB family protein [Jeongeupia sp. USM3]|uniref:LrgB family protein n=1 Tax=Jeongeupia sp. USM3 TaxID=1906741 RepID=UPI00089DE162|nr:LrgB family protein [Jeongeupia sp. USM3]AOY00307.1 hypothetical protein BJP62_07515 [Jeongeupia sp. USM3]
MNFDAAFASLKAAPLLWLLVTGLAYLLAEKLYRKSGHNPLLHPVLVAIALIIAILGVARVPYPDYFSGARFFHLLLGPATVALAVPLYDNLQRVRSLLVPLSVSLFVGGVTGIVSALLLGRLFGLSWPVQVSFAPKSVTTPIAMALADKLGGLAPLTANLVIITGIVGAIIVVPLMRWLKVTGEIEQGLALGVAAHGVGTARGFQLSTTTGAFSGLAMGLNGVLTSIVLPVILAFWPH